MTSFVVDCSVAIQWYVEEDGYLDSRLLLESDNELFTPSLALAEFGNVCWKKARRGEMARASAEAALASFGTDVVHFVDMTSYVDNALQFALDSGLTVYDSLYASLALAMNSPLVTNDTRLHAALSAVNPDLVRFPSEIAS
ncbi:MAG: type II toxin-antitoxin system VapC family toxin [Dehalococcoidia bacterium]